MKRLIAKIKRELTALRNKLTISRDFRAKLGQNYHALTWPERLAYRLWYYRHLSPADRFFFEGERGLAGQMYIRDRAALHETILHFKPRYCIEIGTWTGGGSTFFLADAFRRLGNGTLFTLESDRYTHDQARRYYRHHLPALDRHINFVHGHDITTFKPVIESFGGLDCCFLDGAEDSTETAEQYKFLEPYFRPGTILMAHDWHTTKTAALRPQITADPHWQLVKEIGAPESVGFVVFKRV